MYSGLFSIELDEVMSENMSNKTLDELAVENLKTMAGFED